MARATVPAVREETTQGNSAPRGSSPTQEISRAKRTAVMGLPKTAENPALMPHMMARSWNSGPKRAALRTSSAREPPICRAAPSRPAEPPKAWVSTVAQNTTGASRRETGCSPRAAWMIRSVPPAVLMPPRRYIHTTASPARGRHQAAQAVPFRSRSAHTSRRSNRPPSTPTTRPTPGR